MQVPFEVPEQVSFPKEEESVLQFWKEKDCFRESVKRSEGRPKFTFYDGPPFATGMPHYGHILAGTIKDVVGRWATQTGHHCERRFGWDCHGLPIEFEIEKMLGIKTKEQVMEYGIANYNQQCRGIVQRFSKDWERVVGRCGRWVDFDNDYKTMDLSFMESVWWVFKQLHEKGLVYRGVKVMPFSTGCTTTLSNFEANMNYKDASDPSVTIHFPLDEDPSVSLLAWTTTPWTLPSNIALCAHPTMTYVKVKDLKKGATYILAKPRLSQIFDPKKPAKDLYEILEEFPGQQLEGKKYQPLFDYFIDKKEEVGAFRVLIDTYVTADAGTGLVHQAPGFGDDDYRVCLKNGIVQKGCGVICPVDDNGRFTAEVKDFVGQYIKDADPNICAKLKEMGRLVKKDQEVHSYPFCWRSNTPLIYKACASWFVEVEAFKDKVLDASKKTYWMPASVQEGRFHNWLLDAKDWCVSRSRYWGTPLPIWHSDDWEEIVVIGSVAELEELTGKKFTDIHREFLDEVTIPSKQGKGDLKRVPEVFDCWFESGSMPYAQIHYPFEKKEGFDEIFPADFIAEGIDQTRGWFYTLMVLSTALFGKAPFKNLVVNGLVLAADKKKMSKSLKNYPDPTEVIDEHSADALRLYLITSPVVRAENLAFQKQGVKDVVREVLIPVWNAQKFFVQNYQRYTKAGHTLPTKLETTNVMDKWILAVANHLIQTVRKEMELYRLFNVVPALLKFLDNLTNWYVRMNRRRLKGEGGPEDCGQALATLHKVLMIGIHLLSPFTPFITETMYQRLSQILPEGEREESVHYTLIPDADLSLLDPVTERKIERMQTLIELVRVARYNNNLSLKMPVAEIIVIHPDQELLDDIMSLEQYLLEEGNCMSLKVSSDEAAYVEVEIKPDLAALGKRLKKEAKAITAVLNKWTKEDGAKFLAEGSCEINGQTLTPADFKIIRNCKAEIEDYATHGDGNILILVDKRQDEALLSKYHAREVVNRVQKLRKKAGLIAGDPIKVYFENCEGDEVIASVVVDQASYITENLRVPFAELTQKAAEETEIIREETEINGKKFLLVLTPP